MKFIMFIPLTFNMSTFILILFSIKSYNPNVDTTVSSTY